MDEAQEHAQKHISPLKVKDDEVHEGRCDLQIFRRAIWKSDEYRIKACALLKDDSAIQKRLLPLSPGTLVQMFGNMLRTACHVWLLRQKYESY